jgi:Fic family protein
MGRANRHLAEYKRRLRRLPHSDLLLSPLRLQEAVLSSRMEGTLATLSEVLQFEAGHYLNGNRAAKTSKQFSTIEWHWTLGYRS